MIKEEQFQKLQFIFTGYWSQRSDNTINSTSTVILKKSMLKRKALKMRFKHLVSNTESYIQVIVTSYPACPIFSFLLLTLLKYINHDILFWHDFCFWPEKAFEGRKFSPLMKNDSAYRRAQTVQTEFLPLVHWPHHAPYAADVSICCYLCCCSQHEVPVCSALHSW